MKRHILIFVIAAILAFSAAGCSISVSSASQEPSQPATIEPTPEPTPTPTEAPTPSPTPEPTDNIYGASSASGYVNDALGFSIPYPEGYTVLTTDQINSLMSQIIDQIESMYTDPDVAQQALSQTVPVAMIFKYPLTYVDGFNANINIVIFELPVQSQIFDIMTIVTMSIDQASSQAPSLEYGDPSSLQLGGKDAVSVSLSQYSNGFDVTQKQYYFMCDNYLVTITTSAGNADDLNELDSIVQSIQFE